MNIVEDSARLALLFFVAIATSVSFASVDEINTVFHGCDYARAWGYIGNSTNGVAYIHGTLPSSGGWWGGGHAGYSNISPSPTGAINVPGAFGLHTVVNVGDYSYCDCSGLTDVTIPNYVTNIGVCAFVNCSSITNISIPSGVVNIAASAFSGCINLEGLVLPSAVRNIGSNAFARCTSLESLTMPTAVKSIGSNAFEGCNNLKEVNILDLANWCSIAFEDPNANPLSIARMLKAGGVATDSIIIPSSAKNIGNYAFMSCTNLVNVAIPGSVNAIGDCAFAECSNLVTATIGYGVTHIGTSAFSNCENLRMLSIPASVETIEDFGFAICRSLDEILLGSGVSEIGRWAFYHCDGARRVDLQNAKHIGESAFWECSSLEKLDIPDSVTSIGSSSFESCSNLSEVRIGSGVTTIPIACFSGCWNLREVEIGANVSSIMPAAFYGCSSLKKIVFHGDAPYAEDDDPELYIYGSFGGVPSDCEVYIHEGTEGWEIDEEGKWHGLAIRYINEGGGETGESPCFDSVLYVYHNWETPSQGENVRAIRWMLVPKCPDGWEVNGVTLQGKSRWLDEWQDLDFENVYLDWWSSNGDLPAGSVCGTPAYVRAVMAVSAMINGVETNCTIASKNILFECAPADDADARALLSEIPHGLTEMEIMEGGATLSITNGETAAFAYALWPSAFTVLPSSGTIKAVVRDDYGYEDCIGIDEVGNIGWWLWTAPNSSGEYRLEMLDGTRIVATCSIFVTKEAICITEDVSYEEALPEMVTLAPGATITIRPRAGELFLDADAVTLLKNVSAAPGREGQDASFFTPVARIVDGNILIESKIDKNAVGLGDSISTILNEAIGDPATFVGKSKTSLSIDYIKPGFYYGLSCAANLESLETITPAMTKATSDGVTIDITKPGNDDLKPTAERAFMKLVISDKTE